MYVLVPWRRGDRRWTAAGDASAPGHLCATWHSASPLRTVGFTRQGPRSRLRVLARRLVGDCLPLPPPSSFSLLYLCLRVDCQFTLRSRSFRVAPQPLPLVPSRLPFLFVTYQTREAIR
eukprot:13060189-Heterocapsa_arctica.AAC.1